MLECDASFNGFRIKEGKSDHTSTREVFLGDSYGTHKYVMHIYHVPSTYHRYNQIEAGDFTKAESNYLMHTC